MPAVTSGKHQQQEHASHGASVSHARASRSRGMRVLPVLAFLTACSGPGAMHQATLVGQCAADDAACSPKHPLAPIAVGARFHPEVEVEVAGTSTPNLHMESAAPDVLSVDGDVLVGNKPG